MKSVFGDRETGRQKDRVTHRRCHQGSPSEYLTWLQCHCPWVTQVVPGGCASVLPVLAHRCPAASLPAGQRWYWGRSGSWGWGCPLSLWDSHSPMLNAVRISGWAGRGRWERTCWGLVRGWARRWRGCGLGDEAAPGSGVTGAGGRGEAQVQWASLGGTGLDGRSGSWRETGGPGGEQAALRDQQNWSYCGRSGGNWRTGRNSEG